MKKIFLSPSNQPANKYICSTMTEKKYCEQVCNKIASIWDNQYFNEHMLAPYNVAYNLRPSYAVKFGAHYYFAVHTNASGQAVGTARGAVIFYNNEEGRVIAEKLVAKLNAIAPHEENRSNQLIFRTSGLAEISAPHKFGMTVVFIEIDFHDNPKVCSWLLSNQDQISDVMAHTLAESMKLEKKAIEVPPTREMYRVKVEGRQHIALSYYDRAVEHLKELVDSGVGKYGVVERDTDSKVLFTYTAPVASVGILRGIVTAYKLNVRDNSSLGGKIIKQLDGGDSVSVLKKENNWYLIELAKAQPQRYGWVYADYIKLATTAKAEIRYNTANLNLRSEPKATSTILLTIPKGSRLVVYGYVNGWFELKYKERSGFVHGDYLSLEHVSLYEAQIVNCSRLNMRTSPNGDIIMSLPVGTKLELLDSSDYWWKIRFNGVEGFCSSKYLKKI